MGERLDHGRMIGLFATDLGDDVPAGPPKSPLLIGDDAPLPKEVEVGFQTSRLLRIEAKVVQAERRLAGHGPLMRLTRLRQEHIAGARRRAGRRS